MTTKTLSYEQLIEKRDSLKKQMDETMKNDKHFCSLEADKTFCMLYVEYRDIVEKIQEIDDYWNAHD